jgi:hypothetical protein
MFLLSKEEQARTISILIRVSIESKETIEIDDFLLRPLSILYVKKLDIESLFYNSHCIQVHLDCVDVMDFGLEEDAKNILVEKGRDAVKVYIKQQPKLKRRNSFS